MDKRFQVFVSSTYEDLREERLQVIQSLLEFDCIPVGMEFFPAADDSAWEVIKKVIEESDYYVVIVAGRYGSLSLEGISYTQKEYDYAIQKGVPVIAFLHGDPGKIAAEKTESNEESRQKLEDFRQLCKQKLCKYWKTPEELAGAVLKSLNQLKKTHPAVGWVRADQVPDESTLAEILKLRNRVEEFELERDQMRTTAPEDTENLAQGEDTFLIHYTFQLFFRDASGYSGKWRKFAQEVEFDWNNIFNAIAPLMISEASEFDLHKALNDTVSEKETRAIYDQKPKGKNLKDISIHASDLHTIIIQLRSLGLITQSEKRRHLKDTEIYWRLTPYGDALMSRLRAIKRPTAEAKPTKLKNT